MLCERCQRQRRTYDAHKRPNAVSPVQVPCVPRGLTQKRRVARLQADAAHSFQACAKLCIPSDQLLSQVRWQSATGLRAEMQVIVVLIEQCTVAGLDSAIFSSAFKDLSKLRSCVLRLPVCLQAGVFEHIKPTLGHAGQWRAGPACGRLRASCVRRFSSRQVTQRAYRIAWHPAAPVLTGVGEIRRFPLAHMHSFCMAIERLESRARLWSVGNSDKA